MIVIERVEEEDLVFDKGTANAEAELIAVVFRTIRRGHKLRSDRVRRHEGRVRRERLESRAAGVAVEEGRPRRAAGWFPVLVTVLTTPPTARPNSAEYTPVFDFKLAHRGLRRRIADARTAALFAEERLVVVGAVDLYVVLNRGDATEGQQAKAAGVIVDRGASSARARTSAGC